MQTKFDPFNVESIRVLQKIDSRLVDQMRLEVDNFQCFIMSELLTRVNKIACSLKAIHPDLVDDKGRATIHILLLSGAWAALSDKLGVGDEDAEKEIQETREG